MTQHDRLFRIRTLVALSLLVLAPLTADAAGTITGLKVTPSPATVGTTVMVWMNGTGVCAQLELDFGDGTAKAKLGGPFNLKTQHKYTQVGTFPLKAQAKLDCQGEASASLTVVQGGQITGLTVPSSASPNSQVPITVQGTGTCGSLELAFGDGSKATLPQATLPVTTQHPYTTTGSKTLKATAGTQCQGQAQATLKVTSAITDLCAKVDCGSDFPIGKAPEFCMAPKITGVMLFSNITPGGTVAIKGCGFGSTPGKLILGLSTFQGGPKQVQLEIIDWTNTTVGGKIPANVTGVKDQQAMFAIVTAGDVASVPFGPVNFRATQDIKLLPQSDVKHWCSTEADSDWCNGSLVSHSPFCMTPFGGSDASAAGRHYTCDDWLGNDNGTDEFQATLKNGWVFHSHDWWEHTAAGGAPEGVCSKVHSTGFTPGGSWTKVLVDWITCSYHGLVMYDIDMHITGPAGVPHK